jgi:hypothetical protein
MSYTQFGLIEATDYNNLVGPPNETAASKLNTIWATGAGSWGYGQSAVAQVAVGGTVAASNWATLVNTQSAIGAHQGTSLTPITAPSASQLVTALTALPTNLTSINNNRLNAASQGGTDALSVTRPTSWSSVITFTHIVQFANGDAARHFFNAGGQLAITASHPAGSGIDGVVSNMASNVGTIVISSPNGSTISIAGTSYQGVTKIGGGGVSTIPNSGLGYYALTGSPANVFTQSAEAGSYVNSFIRILLSVSGNTANSAPGSTITVSTVWDEVPDGSVVSAGSTTTLTARIPSTTYIANSWGTINLGGSQSGS